MILVSEFSLSHTLQTAIRSIQILSKNIHDPGLSAPLKSLHYTTKWSHHLFHSVFEFHSESELQFRCILT